jgi:thioredoxin-related protein
MMFYHPVSQINKKQSMISIQKLTIVISLLITFSYTNAQISFSDGSWEEIQEKAMEEKKFILLDGYTEWCGFCKIQDEEIFAREDVGEVVNKHFVPVKIDMEKGIGPKLSAKFRVSMFPTLLFFNPQGQLVEKQMGYNSDPDEFIKDLHQVLAIKEERKFAYNSKDLEAAFPDFYTNSFIRGTERKENILEIAHDYLDNTVDIFSEEAWSVMLRFGASDKINDAFLENYDTYKSMYGIVEAEYYLSILLDQKIKTAAEQKDRVTLDKWLKFCEEKSTDREIRNRLEIQYYRDTEDWEKYVNLVDKIFKEHDYAQLDYINQVSWNIYEQVDAQVAITKAVKWMEYVITKSKDYNHWDTYVALLHKNGQYEKALEYADKTIKLGIEQKSDVSATKELIKRIRLEINNQGSK